MVKLYNQMNSYHLDQYANDYVPAGLADMSFLNNLKFKNSWKFLSPQVTFPLFVE